jgi:hypothetical protein
LGINVSESNEGLSLRLVGGNEIFIYSKTNHTPASFTILNFSVDDVGRTVDDLTGKGVKFEMYNEGELKTDKKGIFRGGLRLHGLKTLLEIFYPSYYKRSDLW